VVVREREENLAGIEAAGPRHTMAPQPTIPEKFMKIKISFGFLATHNNNLLSMYIENSHQSKEI
jgi:hypothetical protein